MDPMSNASHRLPAVWLWLAVSLLSSAVPGCGSPPQGSATATPSRTVESPNSSSAEESPSRKPGLSEKIKFKNGDGTTAFSIKPKDDGAKLVDGGEAELARFTINGRKLKVKDANDVVVAYVTSTAKKYKIEDPSQSTLIYALVGQPDGDWKLEDAQEKLIYRVKKRDYGYEVENAEQISLYKIKPKGAKTVIRNASDQTVFSTNDTVSPLAAACLVFQDIEDLRLRAALFTSLNSNDQR